MDPNLPLSEVKTMDQIKDESLAGDRFTAAFLEVSPRSPCSLRLWEFMA